MGFSFYFVIAPGITASTIFFSMICLSVQTPSELERLACMKILEAVGREFANQWTYTKAMKYCVKIEKILKDKMNSQHMKNNLVNFKRVS